MCGKRRCSALTDAPHRAADQMCEEGFELLSQTSSFRYLLFFLYCGINSMNAELLCRVVVSNYSKRFIPAVSVAVRNAHNPFCLLPWLDDT